MLLCQGCAAGTWFVTPNLAALALEHGVTEFLSADGDFARFRGLRVRNPFVA